MAYDLATSRFGATTGTPVLSDTFERLEGHELVETFERQTQLLTELVKAKNGPHDRISKIANAEFRASATEVAWPSTIDENLPGLRGMPREAKPDPSGADTNAPPFETLVGLLPYKRLSCRLADREWILRARASLTGCALQTGTRQTKLWWTFEGIPIGREPASESEAVIFNQLAERLEQELTPLLRTAFIQSLQTITGRPASFEAVSERIRITLCDNDTAPIAELVDAISLYNQPVSSIQETGVGAFAPARAGLVELETFVGHVAGAGLDINDHTLQVEKQLAPDVVGLFGRDENVMTYATLVAGFARRTGGGSGFGVRLDPLEPAMQEQWVRSVSPSRQLGALLANVEARKLERRLGLH